MDAGNKYGHTVLMAVDETQSDESLAADSADGSEKALELLMPRS